MITMRHVVDALVADGTLPTDSHDEIAARYASDSSDIATPWYVRALLGASAWFAAILLLIFLFGFGVIDNETGALIVGVVLCTTTVVVRRVAGPNLFLGQLSLALSLTGQVLVVGGIGALTDSFTTAAIATIILQSLLIALYPDQLHRFLSTLAIIAALVALVFDWEADLALHALVVVAALGAVVLWKRELELIVAGLEEIVRPIAYGLTFGLLALVSLHLLDDGAVRNWWLSTLGLMGVLVLQVAWLLREYRVVVTRNQLAMLVVFAIILGALALDTPGLIAALIVLLLGFRHTNRLLLGLAAAFLVIFLSMFYYTLSLTLLGKSLVLIGSGIALFALRWVVGRGFQTGEVPS